MRSRRTSRPTDADIDAAMAQALAGPGQAQNHLLRFNGHVARIRISGSACMQTICCPFAFTYTCRAASTMQNVSVSGPGGRRVAANLRGEGFLTAPWAVEQPRCSTGRATARLSQEDLKDMNRARARAELNVCLHASEMQR